MAAAGILGLNSNNVYQSLLTTSTTLSIIPQAAYWLIPRRGCSNALGNDMATSGNSRPTVAFTFPNQSDYR